MKFRIVIICLALLIIGISVISIIDGNVVGERSQINTNTVNGLKLSVTASSTGAEYTISNFTAQAAECGTGAECFLEVQKDGEWYSVRERGAMPVTGEMYVCVKGSPLTMTVPDWTPRYGTLPSGHYRLVKSVYCSGASLYISAEFDI